MSPNHTRARSYSFANKLWTDSFYVENSRLLTIFKITAFSVAPWVIGALVSYHYNILPMFIDTPIFYLAVLAIFLTISTLIYGSLRHFDIYERLLECFDITADEKRQILRDTLNRYYDAKRHFRASLIGFIVSALLTFFGFTRFTYIEYISNSLSTKLPRFVAFSRYGWYDQNNLIIGMAIVVIYAIFISASLGTAISIMIRLPLILFKIYNFTPLPPPRLIKTFFEPMASFYMIISMLWIFCAFLLLYFFGLNGDYISYSFVLGLVVLGLATFALPQISYIRAITISSERYSLEVWKRLESQDEVRTKTDGIDIHTTVVLLNHDYWVYPLHQTYIIVGMYILSFVKYKSILDIMKITLP